MWSQDAYEGLYCVGCEQYYRASDLQDGRCPEHRTAPEVVKERNYFFRLSRYQAELARLIQRDRLSVKPATRRNEVLAFLREPLADLSISRSTERTHGWGIPVPDDPSQVVYVWFDALANYISACGYGSDPATFDARRSRTSSARASCGSMPSTGRQSCCPRACGCRTRY